MALCVPCLAALSPVVVVMCLPFAPDYKSEAAGNCVAWRAIVHVCARGNSFGPQMEAQNMVDVGAVTCLVILSDL